MQLWLWVWEAEEEGEDWQQGCPWPQTQFCFTKEEMNTELCRAQLCAEQPGEDKPQRQDRTKAKERCFSLGTGCFCLKYPKQFSGLSSCLHLPSSRLDCSTAVKKKPPRLNLCNSFYFLAPIFGSLSLPLPSCFASLNIPLPPSPKTQPLLTG